MLAIRFASVALVMICSNTAPLFTSILAFIFLAEHIYCFESIGIVVSFAMVIVIVILSDEVEEKNELKSHSFKYMT